MQDYLKAAEAREYRIAYDFLSDNLKSQCAFEDFVGQRHPSDDTFRNNRVVLQDTQVIDGTAFVDVRITTFYRSGPFGTSESTYTQRFTLRMEDGEWRFSDYPWPYYSCWRIPPEPVRSTPTPTPEPTPTPVPEY